MPRRRTEPGGVMGLTVAEFEEFWRTHWEPGQHAAFVGPTGAGKSTAAKFMLAPRKYVLALDPKGGDDTLKRLRYPRVSKWPPPRKFWNDVADGKPTRRIVGQVCQRPEDYASLRVTLRRCLDDAFSSGGWTVYIDELELAARFMGLAGQIEMFLIAARNKGISVMSAFQRPAHVPTSASSQTTWFATFYTRDTDVVARLGEMAGRPREEMRGMVRGLGHLEYSLLLVSRNPRDPVIVTKPPRAD